MGGRRWSAKERFGQALFAARRFGRGETLALIPLSHLVTELNYSDGGGTSRKVGGSDMYLYLARQRQAGARGADGDDEDDAEGVGACEELLVTAHTLDGALRSMATT